MYAIVEIAGQQFKVEQGKKIFVHRLEAEEGKQINFEKVLLIEDEGNVTIGAPVIEGAIIEAKILDHMRGDKVIVFKKKRKKGYRVRNGHRQNLTHVEIISINGKKAPGKAAAKKTKSAPEEAPVAEVQAEEKPVKKASTKKASGEKAVKKPKASKVSE